ncbi:MAG TPA: PorV/PorQ family protein [Chitinophagaceae bacterium]|nr:PorV/PorQ family protein [Chitinophagaceae bacterium]
MREIFVLMGLAVLVGFRSSGQAKYSNDFLNIGAGARALGMGNAQAASVGDASSGYWNPAGLMYVKDRPEIDLMHAEYFAGIGTYDYGAAAFPLVDQKHVLGISIIRFGVDNIPNTLYLVGPDGSVNYNNITTFSSADYAFLFSYAQDLRLFGSRGPAIHAGGNLKVIYREVGSFAHAWGFGVDLGLRADYKHWDFGVMAKDLTSTFNAWQFSFTDQEKQALYLTDNNIPVKSTEITLPSLIAAAGYHFTIHSHFDLLAELDLYSTFDGPRNTVVSGTTVSIDPRLGIELSYKKIIFLRAGVSNIQRTPDDSDTTNQRYLTIYEPSLGAGFRIHNVDIEYAFTDLANQSQPLYSNIFSIKVVVPKLKRKP